MSSANEDETHMSRPRSMKPLPHPEFARRFQGACDSHPHVPRMQHGRLQWFKDKLAEHGVDVALETIRRWLNGDSLPRSKPMGALAEILGVDRGWLYSGVGQETTTVLRRRQMAVTSGIVNLVAGFIMMDGGHPALPQDNDTEATSKRINLYGLIRGAKYNLHVVGADGDGDVPTFTVPFETEGNVILGVLRGDGFVVRIFELDWDTVANMGVRKMNAYEVPVDGPPWREIKTFADRI